MTQDELQQIETELRSKRIDRRKAALDKLATVDSSLAVPILKKLATEQDFGLRCMAMMGLSNHLTDDCFAYLENVLKEEKDNSVLAEAANSIYDFGEKAIAPLQDLYDRCDYWLVQHTVVSVLSESDDPQVLLNTAKKAIQNENQMTKETGILALSRLLETPLKNEAFDLFEKLATDEYWRNRWRVAIALIQSQEPEAKQLLAQLQKDEDYRVVAAALKVEL